MLGSRKNSAFTLVELLIVIAIIALLAAILFPVFLSAREKARQATCLSNEKQVGLAALQYLQDNDETYPIVDYVVQNYKGPGNPWVTWCWEIEPYAKNWSVFTCPDFSPSLGNVTAYHVGIYYTSNPPNPGTVTPANWDDIDGVAGGGLYEWTGSYAINAAYLNPDVDCVNDRSQYWSDVRQGPPAQLSQFEAPAQTVFAVDTLPLPSPEIQPGSWRNDMHYTDAPADYTAPDACVLGAEWGPNLWNAAGLAHYPDHGTGTSSPCHSGGIDTLFCDGHAKWLTPGALAAGTNWQPKSPATSINITDLSQYLWSLKKTGTHDIL